MGTPYRDRDEDSVLALPRPARAGWWLVAVAGAGLLLLGGSAALAEGIHAQPMTLITLGLGIALAGLAVTFLLGRDRPAELLLRPQRGVLLLRCADGSELSMPFDILARACGRPGENQAHVLLLEKKDGGCLELATSRDEDAIAQLSESLQQAIDSAEPEQGQGRSRDPLERLDGRRRVKARRHDGGLEVCWPAAAGGRTLAAAVGPFGGMFLIFFGFYRAEPSFGLLIAMGFMGALFGVVLWSVGRQMGVTQWVRIDGRQLTAERRVGARAIEAKQIPIFSVVAIDYTRQLNVVGGQLHIRTRSAQDAMPQQADVEALADGEAAAARGLVTNLATLMSGTESLTTGRLSLSECIAVDLALSEELARRSGRVAGQV
jgi:hypothetical protein